MKKKRFLHFFLRSAAQRKGRNLMAALSVMLAVAVVTGMVGITSGVREKLGAELRAYGANVLVSPAKGGSFSKEIISRIRNIRGVDDASGQYFTVASIRGHEVEVIGLELDKFRKMGWKLFGRLPGREGEMLAGINLKTGLKPAEGNAEELIHGDLRREMILSGFIERGGPEDSALIMSLGDAWAVSGASDVIDVVLVRVSPSAFEEAVRQLRVTLPDASVKSVRQVASAEESLLSKIRLLMLLVTAIVVFASSISVASTMAANVFERREEIGLMKALGAKRRDIGAFFFAESLLIGAAGGFFGCLFGVAAAEVISMGAFGTFIRPAFYLPAISLLTGLLLSLVSGYFPVRDAMRSDPAVILRGE